MVGVGVKVAVGGTGVGVKVLVGVGVKVAVGGTGVGVKVLVGVGVKVLVGVGVKVAVGGTGVGVRVGVCVGVGVTPLNTSPDSDGGCFSPVRLPFQTLADVTMVSLPAARAVNLTIATGKGDSKPEV